ncbi:hypothetical protein F4805DRAFT_474543 [Annulohypoxylon moriforme]|nr:hypothetical protein F4805DRAFT_474543 [Annulohypoxylon moriforme]
MFQPESSVPNGSIVTIKNKTGDEITVDESQLIANSNYFKWALGSPKSHPEVYSLEIKSEFATKTSLITFQHWLNHRTPALALDDHRDQGEDQLLNKFLNLVDSFLFGQAIQAKNFQEFIIHEIHETCASHSDDGRLCDVIPKIWEHIPQDSGSVLQILMYDKFYEILGELNPAELAEALKDCEEPFRTQATLYIVHKMNGGHVG